MNDREKEFYELRERVAKLELSNEILSKNLEIMHKEIKTLTTSVQHLSSLVATGRMSIRVLVGLGGIVTGAIYLIIKLTEFTRGI